MVKFLLLFLSFSVAASDLLQEKCSAFDEQKAEIVRTINCPQSGEVREGRYCSFKKAEKLVFFNGCTGISGEYADFFFESCFDHDLCYHHEPSFSGKTKEDCDNAFYADMKLKCGDDKSCKVRAYTFYLAVKSFGEKSWECSNEKLNYQQLK